eukprot:TRINITY_DN60555_c0_g1_i1.p1 TRINITY_DN60555_c0_g1~~TRINITY_DN60555_c0_g1_i1.p1  ORF type:complete len:100 (+),score=27.14 TRINITY_DN60555_c0_g1_i1:33-302(+)
MLRSLVGSEMCIRDRCWGVQVDQMVPSYREHSHLLGSGDAALFPCYDSQLTCATLLRDITPKQQSSSPNQQQPPSSPTTTATKRNPTPP